MKTGDRSGSYKEQGHLFRDGLAPKCESPAGVNGRGLLPGASLHPNTKKRAGDFQSHHEQVRGRLTSARKPRATGS